jgi:hypothetical protein
MLFSRVCLALFHNLMRYHSDFIEIYDDVDWMWQCYIDKATTDPILTAYAAAFSKVVERVLCIV